MHWRVGLTFWNIRRYPPEDRTPDEHDAYSIVTRLKEMDERGALKHYSHPPLTQAETLMAELEGWILGVA